MVIERAKLKRNISPSSWKDHRLRNLKVRLGFALNKGLQEKRVDVEVLAKRSGASTETIEKMASLRCWDCSLDALIDCLFCLDPSVQLMLRRETRHQQNISEWEIDPATPAPPEFERDDAGT